MTLPDRKLVCTGALFTLISAGSAVDALTLDIGSPTEMVPGFFPLMLSIVLACIGLTTVAIGFRAQLEVLLEPWPIWQTAIVISGVFCFAGLIDSHGLIPAIATVVLLSCAPRLRRRPLEVLVILAVMIVLCVGIFVDGIQLPIALW